MATKKVAAKKPAPKKAVAVSKKIAPVKKTAQAKKIVRSNKTTPTKKAVVAKKVLPAKKVIATKKVIKPIAKKNTGKKIEVSKKVVTKKTTVAAKKVITPVNKKLTPKNNNSKVNKGSQKSQPTTKVAASKILYKPVAKAANTPKGKILTKEDNAKALAKVLAAARLEEKVKKAADAKRASDSKKSLVIPKLGTKTSRKYEPDFTKSVLDKAPADPGAPIVMYSDADLADFKDLILRKLGSAKKELAYLQGLITRKDGTGGDDSDGRYMTMEDGSLSMEREQLSQMASRQITFVDHLEKALIRIENKTYGVCRVTGKLIDKARLRAVPHATLSIEAKMGVHK